MEQPPTYASAEPYGYAGVHPAGPSFGQNPYPGGGYYPPPPPPPQPAVAPTIVVNTTSVNTNVNNNNNNNNGGAVLVAVVDSFAAHKSLACFVAWLCNPLFGLVGYILAMVADGTKYDDPGAARRLGKASLGVSISGIIVSILIVIIVASVAGSASSSSSSSSCTYTVYSSCYSARTYVGSCYYGSASLCCSYPYDDYYYNNYCYRY